MVEKPDRFLEEARADGLPEVTAEQIKSLGTTILYMPARTEAIELAFRNKTGLARYLDYRGRPVITAFGPLEVAGLRWAVIAKQDAAEAFAPASRLRRNLLTAAGIAAIALTFASLACAAVFGRPLRRVLAGMKSFIAAGSLMRVPVQGGDEFGELARGYNAMTAAIEERNTRLTTADAEKGDLLRSIYPEAIAERMRNGAAVTAETVSNVTVAFAVIEGFDSMAAELTASESRERLDSLLNAFGKAASAHWVEPLRSLGESYMAVCGLSSPRLDHADSMLAWTRAASISAEQLSKDWGVSISIRFGLGSGEIDVLLLTQGHSAFDVWGPTVSVTRRLAMGTRPGSVAVSGTTYRLLADIQGFERLPMIDDPALEPIVAWVRPAVMREGAQAPQ
jgi:class 3 adenylate cyclase